MARRVRCRLRRPPRARGRASLAARRDRGLLRRRALLVTLRAAVRRSHARGLDVGDRSRAAVGRCPAPKPRDDRPVRRPHLRRGEAAAGVPRGRGDRGARGGSRGTRVHAPRSFSLRSRSVPKAGGGTAIACRCPDRIWPILCPMKLKVLAVASAVDFEFRYGCTPAWWHLWKGLAEIGVQLIVTPYRGRPVEPPWWRTAPNPLYREAET